MPMGSGDRKSCRRTFSKGSGKAASGIPSKESITRSQSSKGVAQPFAERLQFAIKRPMNRSVPIMTLSILKALEQVNDFHFQRLRQQQQASQRYVHLSTLKRPNLRPVKSALVRKHVLGPPLS